ncbi:outer membrane beta-barrel protein [Luteitalea sp.]
MTGTDVVGVGDTGIGRAGLVLLGALAVFASATHASAQEPSPPPAAAPVAPEPRTPFRFGVTFEGYYQWNGNEPPDRVTPLRAYDTRANTFAIQQTAVVIESTPDVTAGRRFGARVDLQFGQATAVLQGSPANEPRPELYQNIWQAYGTYVIPVGRGLHADFGKFASNLGYETNYARDNHHFSRAYLFNFLPYYHTGVRLSLPVHDRVTLMYTLTNGIQQTEEFNDVKSSHVTAMVSPFRSVSWTLSYYAGQEQPDTADTDGPDGRFRVVDTSISWGATPALAFALNANHTTSEVTRHGGARAVTGLAAYGRYQLTPSAALALRYERLADEGLFGGLDQHLQEVTLTYEHRLADGFLVRGEYRRDWSNEPYFPSSRPGALRRAQHTTTAGLVWWFGNKSGPW